jgi:hypothetical protein
MDATWDALCIPASHGIEPPQVLTVRDTDITRLLRVLRVEER